MKSQLRLVPQMPDVFNLWEGDATPSNRSPFWMRWGWCKINDVLYLINREYGLNWKKQDLFTRFGISRSDIQESAYAKQKPPLGILMPGGEQGLMFMHYDPCLLPALEKAGPNLCVPTGWVKDVLWALLSGCTKFRSEEEMPNPDKGYRRAIVACTEDGDGIYYV